MNFDVRRDNAINRNRKGAAGERRRLLRDQLRDLYLLIHREKIRTSRRRTGMAPAPQLTKGQDTGLPPAPKSCACESPGSRSANSLRRRLFRLLVIARCKNRRSRVTWFVYVYRFIDTTKSSAGLKGGRHANHRHDHHRAAQLLQHHCGASRTIEQLQAVSRATTSLRKKLFCKDMQDRIRSLHERMPEKITR